MKNFSSNFIIFCTIFVIIDLYAWQAFKHLTKRLHYRKAILRTYLSVSLLSYLTIIATIVSGADNIPVAVRNYVGGIILMIFVLKILVLPFLISEDLVRGVKLIWRYFFNNPKEDAQVISSKASAENSNIEVVTIESENEIITQEENLTPTTPAINTGLTRSQFLARFAVGVAAVPFASLGYGIFAGAYNYQVKRIKIQFPNLPKAFHGLKIVQLSDIHTGSLVDRAAVTRGIEMINKEQADYFFFTGDLVNNKTEEAFPWIPILQKVRAKSGKFSILGNHDYGDYYQWNSPEDKQKNLVEMYRLHKELDWELLRNEHRILEKDGERIALIGVENWGNSGNFSKYGNLAQAHTSVEKDMFQILLSHDPSHWDAQIRPEFKDIDLTLSGHTHGMQFGIEIPGVVKVSPASLVYPQWAGLYQNENQYLYVNRGFGFIGYPGRVGILPEITVFELESA